ncbi:MAG TPA: hypothetical protein VN873_03610 [Candidatus Angelobacter sp.]|nr:hypothetical protein [Candidatus Angelobacter sp.]
MKELVAFLLPPATALAGMRITRLILGKSFGEKFAFGFRFAVGLAVGMVVFTQSLLLAALLGANLSGVLGWTALAWGFAELALLAPQLPVSLKQLRIQKAHLWLLLLTPALIFLWLIARLSTLDGTQEFDAAAFWLTKSRMLYFDQGKNLLALFHTSNLAYTHMDYPWLTSALYTLTYGAMGGVNEFVVKVWPFWMLAALCMAILSLSGAWRNPHPAPILLVVLLCFLPATEQFVRQEGATLPLLFVTSMAALLFTIALIRASDLSLAAGILVLGACAATKLEGLVYAALWGGVLAVFCWRRGWLKNRLIWKSILVAACCLAPYFCVRLQKLVSYPEANWLHDGAAAPALVLFHRFPQTVFLSIGQRIFNPAFFHWDTVDQNHLHFIGKWQGIGSFDAPELSVAPWVLFAVIGLTFWKKPARRMALAALLAVIIGQILILSFIISCLAEMQASLPSLIEFSAHIIGRYYYPFFTACLLGTLAIWFLDQTTAPPTAAIYNSSKHSSLQDNLLSCSPRTG